MAGKRFTPEQIIGLLREAFISPHPKCAIMGNDPGLGRNPDRFWAFRISAWFGYDEVSMEVVVLHD